MTLVLIAGVLLVGTAVALSLRAVALPGIRATQRLTEIEPTGSPPSRGSVRRPKPDRWSSGWRRASAGPPPPAWASPTRPSAASC